MEDLTESQKNIANILIEEGKKLHEEEGRKFISFTGDYGNKEADKLINDIENYPHVFVLGCIMDQKIDAERAWFIPYRFCKEIGGFEFSDLKKLDEDEVHDIFTQNKLHFYYNDFAAYFYHGIRKIANDYDGDASKIWNDKPSSKTVVERFRDFHGVGQKISTMAANILVREFKVPMEDYNSIDISVDRQIKKMFNTLGLVTDKSVSDSCNPENEIIKKARELYPEYPGIFDSICWKLGREVCTFNNPYCEGCIISEHCPSYKGK